MEQAATSGGLGLPCSPHQALALYQHLFRCPADLGQLRVALWQVREGQACPSGLELPTALLQMERRRRAQEQLLWDLELLTGAGLGLFWPPWAQFCHPRARGAGSQCSKPRGRLEDSEWLTSEAPSLGGEGEAVTRDSEDGRRDHWTLPEAASHLADDALWPRATHQPFQNSRQCPSSQAEDSLSQSHQLPGRRQGVAPSSAPDLGEARSDADPRSESPSVAAEEPTPGGLQELNPTTDGCFGEPGNAEFKDPAQREERARAEPMARRPHRQSFTSPQEEQLAQGPPGPSGLPSQGLPEPQDSPEALGWSLGPKRAEPGTLLRTETPQSLRAEDHQGQSGEAFQGEDGEAPQEKTNQDQSGEATQVLWEEVPEGPRTEAPQGENEEAPQGQGRSRAKCQRKEALQEAGEDGSPQGPAEKVPQSSEGGGRTSRAWEAARGDGADGGRSLEEQTPRPRGRKSPGPWGRTTRLTPVKTNDQKGETTAAVGEPGPAREGERALLPPSARSPLSGAGAGMLAARRTRGSGQSERLEALPGHLALVRDPHALQGPGSSPGPARQEVGGSPELPGALGERRGGSEAPKASKAAWPEAPGRDRASAGVSAAQQETALQQLLELHREARLRWHQDREQQRLRVLERLRIARNRHCRVHPLGPPPSPAQLPPQEDAAGQRRALREQLEQTHRERTGRLRALGARNTQNFQQLLWSSGPEEPASGQHRSPFPAASSHR